jgi:hypothetical protein
MRFFRRSCWFHYHFKQVSLLQSSAMNDTALLAHNDSHSDFKTRIPATRTYTTTSQHWISQLRTIENIRGVSKRANFNQTIYKTDNIQAQAVCLPCIYLLGQCYWFIATMMTTDCWRNNGRDRMRLASESHTSQDTIFRSSTIVSGTLTTNDAFLRNSFSRLAISHSSVFSLRPSSQQLRSYFVCWHTRRIPKDAETW